LQGDRRKEVATVTDADPRKLSTERESALDGLRGAGAIAVMAYHVFDFFPIHEGVRAALLASPVGVLFNGLGALHVFFVLSGHVLALSLGRDDRPARLPRFYARRLFRIHPPYVAAVLFAWVMTLGPRRFTDGQGPMLASAACFHLPADLLPRALMLPSMAMGQLPVGWSLFVELAMSLLFPLMLWFVRRTHPLALVALGLLLVWPAHPRLGFLIFTFDFTLGIAVHLASDRIGAALVAAKRSAIAALLVLAVVLLQLPYAISFWTTGSSGMHARYSPMMIIPMSLGAAILVAAAIHRGSVRRFFSGRWIAGLGTISFSFYLIHFTVLTFLVCRYTGYDLSALSAIGVGVVAFVISIGLSILGYRFIERPAMRAGSAMTRRMGARRDPPPPAPGTSP
jgi:peptidoglycan/LPS O-acetylase OafA/YrhL